MKYRNWLLLIAAILYSIQLLFKLDHIYLPPLINDYLADVLCLPLLLTAVVWTIRRIKRLPFLVLDWKMILFAWLYTSLIFEYILPMSSAKYTADIYDVAAYFAGGVLFFLLQEDGRRKIVQQF
jgi:hypothetical protein